MRETAPWVSSNQRLRRVTVPRVSSNDCDGARVSSEGGWWYQDSESMRATEPRVNSNEQRRRAAAPRVFNNDIYGARVSSAGERRRQVPAVQ